VKIGPKKRYKK